MAFSMTVNGSERELDVPPGTTLLLERASKRLDVESSRMEFRDGLVWTPDGRALTFQELTHDGRWRAESPSLYPPLTPACRRSPPTFRCDWRRSKS